MLAAAISIYNNKMYKLLFVALCLFGFTVQDTNKPVNPPHPKFGGEEKKDHGDKGYITPKML